MVKIYLDAGHGGKDSGAIGNDLYEKNVTLDITKRIAARLKANYENVEIMMTRDSDVFLSLQERTDKANAWKADVFVAIHINSGGTVTTARGFESHIYTHTDAKTKSFQNVMHEEILKQISGQTPDRGKKASNFHVVRESNMTAILTENLFITNSSDAKLLKSDEFKDKLAIGHCNGLEKFFGLKKSRPPTTEKPDSTKLYQVIAGTFSQKDNADDLAAQLKKDGYDSYVQEKQ